MQTTTTSIQIIATTIIRIRFYASNFKVKFFIKVQKHNGQYSSTSRPKCNSFRKDFSNSSYQSMHQHISTHIIFYFVPTISRGRPCLPSPVCIPSMCFNNQKTVLSSKLVNNIIYHLCYFVTLFVQILSSRQDQVLCKSTRLGQEFMKDTDNLPGRKESTRAS